MTGTDDELVTIEDSDECPTCGSVDFHAPDCPARPFDAEEEEDPE